VAKAGLQPYDVITGVDGQSINQGEWLGWGQFRKLIDPEVDKKIVFNVLRNNKPLLIEAAFGAKPKPQEFTAEDLGVTVQEITEIEYCSYRLRARQGVLVTKVERGSPATTSSSFREGLVYNNNVIIELYNRPTRTVDEFIEAVNILRRDKPAVVLIKLWQGNLITCHALNLKIGSKEKGKE